MPPWLDKKEVLGDFYYVELIAIFCRVTPHLLIKFYRLYNQRHNSYIGAFKTVIRLLILLEPFRKSAVKPFRKLLVKLYQPEIDA